MRRGQARPRAVGPDDRIAGQDAPPSVIAGDVDTLARAGLRHCRSCMARGHRGHQDRKHQRPTDGHAAPRLLNRPIIHRRRQPLFGSRPPKANIQRPWPVPDYQVYSIGCGKVGGRARGHLQKSPCPFKTGHPERWPSGLRRTLGKRVCGKPYRGFESHSLRQLAQGRVFSPCWQLSPVT